VKIGVKVRVGTETFHTPRYGLPPPYLLSHDIVGEQVRINRASIERPRCLIVLAHLSTVTERPTDKQTITPTEDRKDHQNPRLTFVLLSLLHNLAAHLALSFG